MFSVPAHPPVGWRAPAGFVRQTAVADYMLAKDRLFAKLTLDDNEYKLYTQLYDHLKPQAPEPDLVIYLQASVDQLLSRIAKRGRSMEKASAKITSRGFHWRPTRGTSTSTTNRRC